MPVSTSIRSYPDVARVLEQAIESPTGIVAEFPDTKEAHSFATRCNKYRQMDRVENKKIYEPGHPMHGTSIFDVLKISQRGTNVEFKNMTNVTITTRQL